MTSLAKLWSKVQTLEAELFRALPTSLRTRYQVWLGEKLPLWKGECPRCDHELVRANDSYGMDTYFKKYWCRDCGWRDEQPSDEPTWASIYAEVNRQKDEEARRAITDQVAFGPIAQLTTAQIAEITANPDDTAARLRFASWLGRHGQAPLAANIERACATPLPTRWTPHLRTLPTGWYGPIVDLLGDFKPHLRDLQLAHGFPDLVALDARVFLARGAQLLQRAPIRCVYLLDAEPHVAEILRSPLVQRLVGLGLTLARDTPIVDVLRSAPALPRLRHLDVGTGHLFTLAELTALAAAPSLAAVTSIGLRTLSLVDEDDRDYISFWSLSEHGRAVEMLAQRTGRTWLAALLAPAYERTERY